MSPRRNPYLLAHGWSERWEERRARQGGPGLVPARVLRHDGAAVLVSTGDGDAHLRLPPGLAVAVGDWVLVDDHTAREVLERVSLLRRRDPSTGGAQLIAANLDLVGIVCGLDRPVSAGRIERFVALAWDAGAVPLVVLTKADLVPTADEAVRIAERAAPGGEVVAVSAETGDGLDLLRERLRDTTVAFVGESGAGKSRLLNALAGRELASTGAVRRGDHKGRHTTTARQLHVLDGGCRIIDTPGVREVGLWAGADSVDGAFDDIARLAAGCRFRDCRHDDEPGCAVLAAAGSGDLSPDRIASWRRLRREAEAAEVRADEHSRRRSERRFGRMAREAQRLKRR